MGRRVSDRQEIPDKLEDERVARYRLRSLFYVVVLRDDVATAFGAERARLGRVGLSAVETFDRMCEWVGEHVDLDRAERVRSLRPPDGWSDPEARTQRAGAQT